jgi:hypothetical protein
MPLGEKLFEESGKTTGMSVKSITAEGITLESNFVSQIQGFGRFPSGTNMGTGTTVQGPNTARGTGQGVFITKDGKSVAWHLVAIGESVEGKSKSVNLITCQAGSPELAWLNELLILIEGTSAPDLSTFSDVGYEWK